jgi:hypothetical protein
LGLLFAKGLEQPRNRPCLFGSHLLIHEYCAFTLLTGEDELGFVPIRALVIRRAVPRVCEQGDAGDEGTLKNRIITKGLFKRIILFCSYFLVYVFIRVSK